MRIENKQCINPAYYDSKAKKKFDLRKAKNKSLSGPQTNYIKSVFWNPKTGMVLTKKSDDANPNIPTNTVSFAKTYNKSAPKYKVLN